MVGTSFRFRAYNSTGDIVQGTCEAGSNLEARNIVWERGLVPLAVTPEAITGQAPWWRRDIQFAQTPTLARLAHFTREFAILSQAELPLDTSLKLLEEQTTSRLMKQIIRRTYTEVMSGASVSAAMRTASPAFTADYISVLEAGESGGRLAAALSELADLLERRIAIADKLKSALLYPCVLLIVALGSMVVIIGLLAPALAPIFEQSQRPLPSPLVAALWMGEHAALLTLSLTSAAFCAIVIFTSLLQTPRARLAADSVILKTPFAGKIVGSRNAERFFHTFAALLRAGVPTVTAFASARQVVNNRRMRREFSGALDALRDGIGLAEALSTHCRLPTITLQMVAIGESSGRLETMLHRSAVNLALWADRRIARIMTLLAPALTIAVALLIGGLVFTTMDAILSMNEIALQ